MKAIKITLILIFSLLTCQLFADDKGSTTKTDKPKTIDIEVVNLPEFPIYRSIVFSFEGYVYSDHLSLEANFPVGEVAVQIVNAGNQVVVEKTVYFNGETVHIHTEGLEQGEYRLVLKFGSMVYQGAFRIN